MNEKFNKNTKVEQLTKIFLSHGEEKGLTVKDPLEACRKKYCNIWFQYEVCFGWYWTFHLFSFIFV